MDERITEAAREIATADRTVALTGAGVSTESGIPDFRSEGGLWERYDPGDFHIRRFERDAADFWTEWLTLHEQAFGEDVEPNPAHEALASLESAGHMDAIITQNVDGLHQSAGSEEIIRLHGSRGRVVCRRCDREFDADPAVARARDGERPPRCEACDGILKPGSVLFGERLPEHALLRAHAHAEKSDVFLVVGSSLTVEPAASLPRTAVDTGATLIVVNLDPTPLADRAHYAFRDRAGAVLPQLRDAVARFRTDPG